MTVFNHEFGLFQFLEQCIIKIMIICNDVQHRCFVCSGLMNSPTKARHQDYQIETGNLNMDHALDSISAPLKGKCKNLHAMLFILLRLYGAVLL